VFDVATRHAAKGLACETAASPVFPVVNVLTLQPNQKTVRRTELGSACTPIWVGGDGIIEYMPNVTQILNAIVGGDRQASDQLLPVVYQELRRLAAARVALEKPGQTLQATALVHEAYLRLVGDESGTHWNGRAHFFGAAAEAMRRILVDEARRKGRRKRGGEWQREDIELVAPAIIGPNIELLDLDEALAELALVEPAKAELVKLRYFVGLTLDEAAETLGISSATADRYWKYARAWLADRLRDEDSNEINAERPAV
jgi:RNA polymerase sigma factor (TIGR02999 family)